MPTVRLARRSVLAGLLATPAFADPPAETPITVFAAASLQGVLDRVGFVYVALNAHPVRFSYGASSALARQIEEGAPADVFISADPDWMDYLTKKKLIVEATRRNLLSNRLALIAPANANPSLEVGWKMPIGRAMAGGRLAVAGPDVPAGRYAQASLTKLGVWNDVKDHLAPAQNVRAALAFVARGETPFGIVYDTDAMTEPKVKIVGLFPDDSHPPIIYPGAVLTAATSPNAKPFLDSLTSPKEADLFRKAGFKVLRR